VAVPPFFSSSVFTGPDNITKIAFPDNGHYSENGRRENWWKPLYQERLNGTLDRCIFSSFIVAGHGKAVERRTRKVDRRLYAEVD
jgi:hypothetical protein